MNIVLVLLIIITRWVILLAISQMIMTLSISHVISVDISETGVFYYTIDPHNYVIDGMGWAKGIKIIIFIPLLFHHFNAPILYKCTVPLEWCISIQK